MLISKIHAYIIEGFLTFYMLYGFTIVIFQRCLFTIFIEFLKRKFIPFRSIVLSTWFFRQLRTDKKRWKVLHDIQWNDAYLKYYPSFLKREIFIIGGLLMLIIWWAIMLLCIYFPFFGCLEKLSNETDYDVLLACQVTVIGLFVPLVVSAVTSLLQNRGEGFFVNYYYKRIQFNYYLSSSTSLAVLLIGHAFFSPYIGTLFILWFILNIIFSAWIIFQSVSLFVPSKLDGFVRECIANELVEEVSRNTGEAR